MTIDTSPTNLRALAECLGDDAVRIMRGECVVSASLVKEIDTTLRALAAEKEALIARAETAETKLAKVHRVANRLSWNAKTRAISEELHALAAIDAPTSEGGE